MFFDAGLHGLGMSMCIIVTDTTDYQKIIFRMVKINNYVDSKEIYNYYNVDSHSGAFFTARTQLYLKFIDIIDIPPPSPPRPP